ncbi:Predicted protein [Wolbachia endosymbiont strain TRS of Brugia malayi]|nr:Predicted protein [Wolbachia endosymbiont strain TRS of Brugia malayi]
MTIPEKMINLCYNSADSVSVEYSDVIVVKNLDPEQLEQYKSSSKLEFTLKFQNGKVEYKNSKVTLTIPEQLKNCKANGKSLLGDINEHFKDTDNEVVECLVDKIADGLKSFIINPEDLNVDGSSIINKDDDAPVQILDSTEYGGTTEEQLLIQGIVNNVVGTLAGIVEVPIGMATDWVWPQDQK